MGYNILIVDDSATTRAMIKRTIQMCGIDIASMMEAPDGQAALDMLSRSSVDLVLADLHMPNMTGGEMTRKMRQTDALKGTPVIVVTAEPSIKRLAELAEDGVQAFVRKPFTPEGIRKAISQVLEVTHA